MNQPEIIYEDQNLIAVSKPAGMPVHEAKHSDDYSLCDWLLLRYPEIEDVGDLPKSAFREGGSAFGQPYRPGIVHRLDKQTSGVMVIARTQETFLRLKEIFKTREVEKIYTALVCGKMKEKSGMIDKPIGRVVSTPTKMAIDDGKRKLRLVKNAITEYKVLKEFQNTSLLEVHIKTGRMHQIRVHLASLGRPIAGDTVYGGTKVCHATLGRYFLHASSLLFSLESGKMLKFEADLPLDLQSLLAQESTMHSGLA